MPSPSLVTTMVRNRSNDSDPERVTTMVRNRSNDSDPERVTTMVRNRSNDSDPEGLQRDFDPSNFDIESGLRGRFDYNTRAEGIRNGWDLFFGAFWFIAKALERLIRAATVRGRYGCLEVEAPLAAVLDDAKREGRP